MLAAWPRNLNDDPVRASPARRYRWVGSHSTQLKVRVTAFFHP